MNLYFQRKWALGACESHDKGPTRQTDIAKQARLWGCGTEPLWPWGEGFVRGKNRQLSGVS